MSRPMRGEDRTLGGRDLDVSDVEIGALLRSGRSRVSRPDPSFPVKGKERYLHPGMVRLPRKKELSAAITSCSGCGPEPALRPTDKGWAETDRRDGLAGS